MQRGLGHRVLRQVSPRIQHGHGNEIGGIDRRPFLPDDTVYEATVKAYQRKQLLERINREGSTIGERIPERIRIGDEEVPLREFVFEIKRRDTIPAGERKRVERAKKNLRRERVRRVNLIENDEVTFAEGKEEARTIAGIDRALNALESLEPTDIESEAAAQEAADRKRWMTFLRKALGHEQDNRGRR